MEQLVQFREWFLEFDAKNRDRQIEDDAAAERLNALAEKALYLSREIKADRIRRLSTWFSRT